jgi:hypothetical protein
MSEALAIPDDAALFNDADFAKAVQERTKNRAKAFFHGRGIERLIEIANGDNDKTAITAINTIGRLAGEFTKPPRPIHISFDDLRNQAATVDAGPLAGITQIQAPIIDVEDEGNGNDDG